MYNINDNLKPTERIDDLQYNGLQLIQDSSMFCFGCDAVELANFVKKPICGKNRACDLGSGNGIIAILLSAKKGYAVDAVEIQSDVASLCKRNVALNSLTDKITVNNIDMQSFCKGQNKGFYDVVVCNPPYEMKSSGMQSENEAIKTARSEEKVTLEEVIKSASHLTKFGGRFYIVHKAERLAEVLFHTKNNNLEPKVLQVLRPNDKKPPHLFLLSCTYGAKSGLVVEKERVVNAFEV